MKDSFFSDDLADVKGFDTDMDMSPVENGMRHSIRARRKPTAAAPRKAQVVKTQQAKAVLAPKLRQEDLPEAIGSDDDSQCAKAHSGVLTQDEVITTKPGSLQVTKPQAPALLTRWDDLHKVAAGARKAANKGIPVVDLARDNISHRAFDLLRTRLRQTTQENKWVNIGITAPTTGCGTTFTAVNLALSLSRVSDSRTVLMDMNLRDPKVMVAFDMTPPGEMQDYLSGAVEMKDHMMRISDTLALGLNAGTDENAAETLQNAKTHATLAEMREALAPELVVYDLPPMLVSDDVSAFLPQLDGVLLVSDGMQTTANQLLECERMLGGQVPLLGVILNRARSSSIPRYS